VLLLILLNNSHILVVISLCL